MSALVRVGNSLKYPLTCGHCGRDFLGWKKTQPFCSRLCFTTNRKLKHPRKPCERCGSPVGDLSPARRFCSRICAAAAATHVPQAHCRICGVNVGRGATTCIKHHHTPKREARRRDCAHCGKSYIPYYSALKRGNKYCSLACHRAAIAPRYALITVACRECGSEFRRTRAAIARVKDAFCSSACSAKNHSREGSPNWRGGHDSNRGPYWRAIAEDMRKRDGYRCRMCGKTQEANGQKLSVDHIIPWRSFESKDEANDPANLASLCRVCHGKKGRAENAWLKGDVLDMWRYQIAVSEPWKAA